MLDQRLAPRVAASAMVFLGGFLSFSMEPLVGRMVTPFFGSAVHVWTVTLMVFQAALLAGYLYAHLLAPRIGAWHLAVICLPLLQWPLGFTSEVAPQAPVAALTFALITKISVFFCVLSTTSVVAQTWWTRSSAADGRQEPFFLYSVSNMGAMTALLSYPFLIEPTTALSTQRWIWSIGYVFYIAITVLVWISLRPLPLGRASLNLQDDSASPMPWASWLLISAATSALLLATTNVIAYEVGSISVIWVLPLALYLASFIVAFGPEGSFRRAADFCLVEIAVLALFFGTISLVGFWVIVAILTCFFVLCVIAHGRLYALRPNPNELTRFYLVVATGGLLGGMFVSLAAPLLFSTVAEYPIAIITVLLACSSASRLEWWKAAPLKKGGPRMAAIFLGGLIVGVLSWSPIRGVSFRNFYGVVRIAETPASEETPAYRALYHGTTMHGAQFLVPGLSAEPISYYYREGAIYQAIALRRRPTNAAIIGLGTGASAMWFDKSDRVDFYEIDPDIERIARHSFSYLGQASPTVSIFIGDARLNISAPRNGHEPLYDLIMVDAFSGDGIPTHLITLEAIDRYLARLEENGLLVFHISNRYYDLRPVLKAAAAERALAAAVAARTDAHVKIPYKIPPWIVVFARNRSVLSPLMRDDHWASLEDDKAVPRYEAWTDDYINILAPIWANLQSHAKSAAQ